MKLGLGPTLSPGVFFRFLEVVALVLIAVQAARLVWIVATPLGPVGEPRLAVAGAEPSAAFDPFFRFGQSAGPAVVTSLPLKLFGVRVDEAMGGGSAIIEAEGVQSSFGVGEEIMPGVRLKQVNFDSVVIDRGGASEQLFLDQSVAAPVAQPQPAPTPAAPAQPAVPVAVPSTIAPAEPPPPPATNQSPNAVPRSATPEGMANITPGGPQGNQKQ